MCAASSPFEDERDQLAAFGLEAADAGEVAIVALINAANERCTWRLTGGVITDRPKLRV